MNGMPFMRVERVTPYNNGRDKGAQMERAFDRIAPHYDLLNRSLSLGSDVAWRRRALRHLRKLPRGARVLDVATGTAELALQIARQYRHAHVTGIDFSEAMLEVGRRKIARNGMSGRITLAYGDSHLLEFPDAGFDAVSVAFGLRNFADIKGSLEEMRRVLKPGGKLIILELSQPRGFLVRSLFRSYQRAIIPRAGGLCSGCKAEYRYLAASIQAMAQGEDILEIMRTCGFTKCACERYTFGICTCYTGTAMA